MIMKYFLSFLLLLVVCSVYSQRELKFEVYSGDYERINTPVSIEINQFKESELSSLALFETTGGIKREIPAQIDQEYGTRLWFTLKGITQPNITRTFLISTDQTATEFQNIWIDKDDKTLKIKSGDKNILQYNQAEVYPPENIKEIYKRSAFIHPVWSPDQQVLTRIQPSDHYHHYGIWNPWTRTKFQGRQVDFWNLAEGQGTVRFKGFLSFTEGPVFGGFRAHQEHIDFTSDQDEVVALNEEWDIRVWNIDTENKVWLVDFTSILNCATEDGILFFKYRYGGGIGYRATELWGKGNSSVLTSEGKTRDEADATRAQWCIVKGETQSEQGNSGILFMSNPQNREHPEPIRMWPSNDHKGKANMFFMFTPIRDNKWELAPGKNYVLRYRLLVFDGELTSAEAEQYWNDFACPPVVKLIK
jgi:hypothetical protein